MSRNSAAETAVEAENRRRRPGEGDIDPPAPRIAVLLPCYNEEPTIAGVVTAFRAALPEARIYVFDNASEDASAACARQAGAIVLSEPRRGKGNVIRRMFANVDADIYIMADGDGTYDAAAAPLLIRTLIEQRVDMVVAARQDTGGAYRPGHRFGNRAFSYLISALFGKGFTDVFSGYRAFTRRFVKSCPVLSNGFEVETELSIHALGAKIPCLEITIPYCERPENSSSKLRTVRDGMRILGKIFLLLKEVRPLLYFGAFSAAFSFISVFLAYPLFVTYLSEGIVPRFPTAILSAALMLAAILSLICGLILQSVSRGRQEVRRLHYLSQAEPPFVLPRGLASGALPSAPNARSRAGGRELCDA